MKKKPSNQNIELFESSSATVGEVDVATSFSNAPLAVRMRPQTLDDIFGQSHLVGEGKLIRRIIQSDRLTSIILYGPPGCGKTSMAKVISNITKAHFIQVNAVESSVSELRSVIENAKKLKKFQGQSTILFIDEIHRFNKAQQDVLMPDVENRNIILFGATTQNPSFSINGPLLSRTTICELRPLEDKDLEGLIRKALKNTASGFGNLKVSIDEDAILHLIQCSNGDARRALNALEVGILSSVPDDKGMIKFDKKIAEESCQRKIVYHDKDGDYHYDIASAFIKSMRGSDPNAAIYWLAKMLYSGEDPRFILRRIMILASEDIGNADPQALILASAGMNAIEFVGMPEARIILSQLVTYMALAPKSNSSYIAISEAYDDVKKDIIEEVPIHLRSSSYMGAKDLGHGIGYKYPHQFEGHFINQEYCKKMKSYYRPSDQGFEKDLQTRINIIRHKS